MPTKSFVLVLVVITAVTAAAQTPPAAPAPQPDVAIFTDVHARELSFAELRDVRASAFGSINDQPAVTVAHSDRQGFPDPAQTHVLYRNIGIQLTITSTLPDIGTIVDEALAPEPAPPPAATPATKKLKSSPHKTKR